MARKTKPKQQPELDPLDLMFKADAEAMKILLRQRGRNPDWVEESYPTNFNVQCFILHELLYG